MFFFPPKNIQIEYRPSACLEPQFYQTFCTLLERNLGPGFNPPSNAVCPEPANQHQRSQWMAVGLWITAAFKTRRRQDWEDVFTGKSESL
jgi:crotonobetainyl-CoA:carnitine CoA-transferase CaiB-like acyl-CoA transferase